MVTKIIVLQSMNWRQWYCTGVNGYENNCTAVNGYENNCTAVNGNENNCTGVYGYENNCNRLGIEAAGKRRTNVNTELL